MGEYRIAFGLGLSLDFCLSRFVERFPCIALAEKPFSAAAKIFTSDGVGAFPVGTLGAYNRFVGFCGDFRPSLAGGLFPALLYCRRALFGAGSGAGSCGVFGKAGAPFGRFALVLFLGDAGVLALGSLFKGNLAAGTFVLWVFDPAIVVDSAMARTASFANFDLFFCAFLDFSILFLIVLYQYLCHCQLDTPHKDVVVIPVIQPETELIHILLQVFHGNYEIYCRPPIWKRLVNSKYVIFVYVVCSHYKDTIFFVKKTKSKVDNSVFHCHILLTFKSICNSEESPTILCKSMA